MPSPSGHMNWLKAFSVCLELACSLNRIRPAMVAGIAHTVHPQIVRRPGQAVFSQCTESEAPYLRDIRQSFEFYTFFQGQVSKVL